MPEFLNSKQAKAEVAASDGLAQENEQLKQKLEATTELLAQYAMQKAQLELDLRLVRAQLSKIVTATNPEAPAHG